MPSYSEPMSLDSIPISRLPWSAAALVGTGLSGTGSADSDGQIHVGIKFHVGIDQLGHGVSEGCGTSERDIGLAVFIGCSGVLGHLVLGQRNELLGEDGLSNRAGNPVQEGDISSGLALGDKNEVPLNLISIVDNIILGRLNTVKNNGMCIVVTLTVLVEHEICSGTSYDDDDHRNDC